MKNILFQVKAEFSLESALAESKKLGLQDHYVIEDIAAEDFWIGGLIKEVPDESELISLHLKGPNDIDWRVQWETFAENFQNGVAHIDLSRFGSKKTLHLLPGEGFGDLSHATTYLMLELMQDRIVGESVVDIGSGSGILSLAAKLMGAEKIIGVEIDPASFYHAQKNALKNKLDVKFVFQLDITKIPPKNLFLMNMTVHEQKEFIKSCPEALKAAHSWIVSGILKEQKEQYLEMIGSWGFKATAIRQKDKWLAMILEK
ncbi:MAG: hypothetical protein COT84_05680 [Chlamydiae bacterium CG10_big_fil_rev_8_21_14_0_10_35_9]|nr:MAG: hypothetical protein COT84_05680 [Chlamydiae bacterium CG10_big_fil_rev_8_21_14_0_10_35_9]